MSYFNDLFVEIWENLAEDDEFLALSQEQQQETVLISILNIL